ncbi:uncharacterized protein LOC125502626 [Dendroctonus ponderosae]|uniref:uncharacterized protein LOC125502626 n=1 Tax=Dendroctonus ponderosae TaxID=77166 RepID=UPI00203627A8|nr:uncharacterized protein LOC125502626 [Dendroctonus ponderosae]
MINKTIKHLITGNQTVSDHVIYITVSLNSRYSMQETQAYAPTSTSDDEKVRTYEDISKALKMNRTKFTIITGDFNAKLGSKIQDDPENIGKFGLAERNNRGKMLLNFLANKNMYCLNTFLQRPKQRR